MRKVLLLVLGVVAASAWLAAQSHDNAVEQRASGMLMVSSEVLVGTHVLPAGEYIVVCDRTKITFTRARDYRVVMQATCKGRHLPAPATKIVLTTIDDEHGNRHASTLLLPGSNVEPVFR